jgi:MoaA/NifB/PqqE/SkfB family radical SAM enzyme
MKGKLVTLLKKNKGLFSFAKALRLLQTSSLKAPDGSKKKYPKVIQLPITYRCNARCVMCNIWRMDNSGEATVEEFGRFLQDDIFKKVEAVGINGGEPTLVSNLHEYADEILKLPALRSLNIISHGFNTPRALRAFEIIYSACKVKGVSFHVSISLDGVGPIHDDVRRIPGGFLKTMATVNELIINQQKYCDSYEIGCTVVSQNIHHLIELDTYAKIKNYNIKYRLGIDNKRIESDKLRNKYSVIYSPLRQSAKEFFHYLMSDSKGIVDKFKYYSIFYWLNQEKPKRLLGCSWKDEGVTLDARGELYYCAVASDSIGSLRKEKGEKIFFDDVNINYRKGIIQNNCDSCIHDYNGKVELKNILQFLMDITQYKYSLIKYIIKAKLMK